MHPEQEQKDSDRELKSLQGNVAEQAAENGDQDKQQDEADDGALRSTRRACANKLAAAERVVAAMTASNSACCASPSAHPPVVAGSLMPRRMSASVIGSWPKSCFALASTVALRPRALAAPARKWAAAARYK